MKAALQPNSKPRWLKPIRWLWFVLALGYGALWLLSVPRFYEQASTLTIEPYKLGERVIYDNARAEKQALERGVSPPVSAIIEIAIVTLQVVVYYLLTALIAWRTTNGFGWFTAFVLLFLSVGSVMEMPVGVARPFPYANVFAEIPGYLVWPAWMLWLHLFPNGHFVPRWSARPVIIVLCLLVVLQISSLLTVLGVLTALPENIDTFAASTLGPILTLPVFGLIFYSQVHRYRYVSTLMERQQTKWFLLGLGMFFIGIFCYTIFPVAVQNSVIAQNVLALTFLIFPISVTLAILRYRLFDVDILIRRTLQYSLISGLLGLTYFGLVIVLQNLTSAVGGQRSEIITVLSTLAIAALFFPLRNRVQEFIDKRFYRKKYDAQKVIADFAATCRDETDLDKLTARLVEVIDETLQPEKISVWIKPPADRGRQTGGPSQ